MSLLLGDVQDWGNPAPSGGAPSLAMIFWDLSPPSFFPNFI
jgi:hypothetical protein